LAAKERSLLEAMMASCVDYAAALSPSVLLSETQRLRPDGIAQEN
jgi:hypothetical protein